MASRVQVIVNTAVEPDPVRSTMGFLEHLEALWSRFVPDSDISRLNMGAGGPVRVAPETLVLVRTMLEAWSATDGLYDPTLLPILVDAGYGTSKVDPRATTALPASAAVPSHPRECIGGIIVDDDDGTVTLPVGVTLDPGGIGKGLAADLAVARLLAGGTAGALVSIGGDLAAGGLAPDPAGWMIDVEHPIASIGPVMTVSIDHGGAATSSRVSRTWRVQDRQHHHIVDPRSGDESDTDLAAVTVFSRSGHHAEAFATAAILHGSDDVLEYLGSLDLSGVAVSVDGRIIASPDLHGTQSVDAGGPVP